MKLFNKEEYLKDLKGEDRLNKLLQVKLVKEFWDDDLDFCVCGTPWYSLDIIKKILNIVYKNFNTNEEDIDFCKEIHGVFECKDADVSMIVYQMLANMFNSVGIMEHGSNVTYSWLTSYGEELRYALNNLSDFELKNLWTIHSMFEDMYKNNK